MVVVVRSKDEIRYNNSLTKEQLMNDYGRYYRQFSSDDVICYGQCSDCEQTECELNDKYKEGE